MDYPSSIEAFKGLFLDILGYFLPGSFLIIILYITSASDLKTIIKSHIISNELLFMILSYISGYILYGVTMIRDQLKNIIHKGWGDDKKRIEDKILKSDDIRLSVEIAEKILSKNQLKYNNFKDNKGNFKLHPIRNFAMSFVPSADTKIYTFMFRADLCNQTSAAIFLLMFIYLIGVIFNFCTPINIINLDYYTIILIVSLLFSLKPLLYTKQKFYNIAMKLIFPIFIAKYAECSNDKV